MIVATRHAGNRELRFRNLDAYTAKPPPFGRWAAGVAGVPVTNETAAGLPAVGQALRLVAGVVATLRLGVFEGQGGARRELPDAWQTDVFRGPAGTSEFDWLWDIAVSVEATGNALLLKAKSQGQVVELVPVPADCWTGWVEPDGRKVFDIVTDRGFVRVSESDALHVRGGTMYGGAFGASRIQQHADPLGSQLAAQRFEGAYFRNHARPDIAIVFPQGVTREQAEQWRDVWTSEYGGPDNAGKPVPLGAGAQVQPIPAATMRDQEWVASRQLGVDDVGRIMDVDPVLLGNAADQDRKAALDLFLRLQLPPRLRRIERALKADLDLFPINDPTYPAFHVDDLMFADPLTRAQVEHTRIQNGSLLADEARADNGRPPLPGGLGQIAQITPVGGAPNPVLEPPDDTDEEE